MWILLVQNGSGVVQYGYVYSTQALAQSNQATVNAFLPPGWSSQVISTPATDTAVPGGVGSEL